MIWGDLFEFVSDKVNFHQVNGEWNWTCHGDLRFAKEFIEKCGLNEEEVLEKLRNTGGYCDCEVLFNSAEVIDENLPLPQSSTQTANSPGRQPDTPPESKPSRPGKSDSGGTNHSLSTR